MHSLKHYAEANTSSLQLFDSMIFYKKQNQKKGLFFFYIVTEEESTVTHMLDTLFSHNSVCSRAAELQSHLICR